jgi:Mor family transcriptional regulator
MADKSGPNWPETLDLILRVFEKLLQRKGIDRGKSEAIAKELALELAKTFGGRMFYLPRGDSIRRYFRNLRIFSEYNGSNHKELAKKYDISYVTVYKIVKQGRLTSDIHIPEENN